jgi:biopolymer transport protein TolQ
MEPTIPATPVVPLDAASLAGSVPSPDMSVISLFLQADTIVKIVMLMLLAASFWTWAIIFEKSLRLRKLRSQAKQFEESFWSGGSLETLFDRLEGKMPDPMSAIFVAAMREWRRSAAKGLAQTEQMRASLQERIERVMDITLGREIDVIERHMTFLASVGSSAPFVGLFGTVWGIMNAFSSLGNVQQATLAMVAPGISEALVTTAIGLFAAIPAVVAYNRYADQASRLELRYDAFMEELSTILQRYAGRGPAGMPAGASASAAPGGARS